MDLRQRHIPRYLIFVMTMIRRITRHTDNYGMVIVGKCAIRPAIVAKCRPSPGSHTVAEHMKIVVMLGRKIPPYMHMALMVAAGTTTMHTLVPPPCGASRVSIFRTLRFLESSACFWSVFRVSRGHITKESSHQKRRAIKRK